MGPIRFNVDASLTDDMLQLLNGRREQVLQMHRFNGAYNPSNSLVTASRVPALSRRWHLD